MSRTQAAPIIDAVLPARGDPRVVRIMVRSVSGARAREAARMTAAEWRPFKAAPGDRWTAAHAARAGRIRDDSAARVAALRAIARRPMRQDALRAHLLRAGHTAAAAGRIVRTLADDGWLDG